MILTYKEFKTGMEQHSCPHCKGKDCAACYEAFLESEKLCAKEGQPDD